MKTLEQSVELARTMVEIGEQCGRKTVALITDMDVPLGNAIGNSMEICEVVDVLSGKGSDDLTHVCVELAANMLYLAEKGALEQCRVMVQDVIESGAALHKLADMVEAQGGDRTYIEEPNRFEKAAIVQDIKAPQAGYVGRMDAEGCGVAAMILGAGRETVDTQIDFSAGIMLHAKTGDRVAAGQTIAALHTSSREKADVAAEKLLACYTFADAPPLKVPLIYERISLASQ
jgi:pyrimidine-nucleoside phosphorylase